MTPREKMIEEFYLRILARVLDAKDDEATLLRAQLRSMARTLEERRR